MKYTFVEWEYGQWYRGPCGEWLTNDMLASLPHPMYVLNQEITFKWSHPPTLTGNIRRIQMHVEEHSYFSTLPLRTTVYVTAYANGHARWFKADKIIKEATNEN